MSQEILKIEKLVFGGQGLAHDKDGRAVFVWNALPEEEVEVEYIEKKKNFAEAVATKILSPSPDRVEPLDSHFLSSSPWQMISWEKENIWKKQIAIETYGKIGNLILHGEEPDIIFSDEGQYGYRNKMEFSFTTIGSDNEISLAFFERGKKVRIPATGSHLASPLINEVAQKILHWVNEQKIPMRSLKSLIVRSTSSPEKVIAALFIKDKLPFPSYPTLQNSWVGFHLYYSTHKSPASVPTELLFSDGQDFLVQNILETPLQFGLHSFFQINPPLFEKALQDMAAFIEPTSPLIDFYAGVGAISLPLSRNRKSCFLVEENSEAVAFAQKNIALNNLKNCTAECRPAEKMVEVIESTSTIILDPPRSGLHEKVIRAIIHKQPKKILYLSCNLSTQARDLRLLSESYRVVFLRLYNFFPRTPHIEGLCVLERVADL